MSRLMEIDGEALDLARAGITQFVHEAEVGSTMDLAHSLAHDGALSGTVVVADVQHAGRGRSGKSWHSSAGNGLWCTIIVRDAPASGLDVLSLRLGMAIADVVSPWCDGEIGLKWPNDVLQRAIRRNVQRSAAPWRKLAGVLVEARWREAQVEWIAIGIGLNLRVPAAQVDGSALRDGVTRAQVLQSLIPRIRAAAQLPGGLSATELANWRERDIAIGRTCTAPEPGVVSGVQADGTLQITLDDGRERAHRSGSLLFAAEDGAC